GIEHAVHVRIRHRATGSYVGREALRREPPAREVHDDRLDLDLRHPLGGIDGLADRLLGRLQIDDDAALETERTLMADAEHAHLVRPAAQYVALAHGDELRDEADDLAGADVEHRQEGALARREGLEARRQAVAQGAHMSASLALATGFFFAASARAAAASAPRRITTRSDWRMSMTRMSRSRMRSLSSSSASRATAAVGFDSGRRTSRPLSRMRFQRRPAMSEPALTRSRSEPAASSSSR